MVQSVTRPKNKLHELGYKIFLDRYALKDVNRKTLKKGDTVIVVVNSQTGQREVGKVTAMALPKLTIELLDGEVVERDIEHVDKPLETDPAQMIERVAKGIAKAEKNSKLRKQWAERFEWLLDDFKFVPAGRILAAAGTDQLLTFYNCYVIDLPHDSRSGIIKTLSEMTEIMSRGGGVGINISSLRPRHSYVKGVNGRSSGSVSWGALYSFVTGLIEQGGCFGPDERILTHLGLIPALELADRIEEGETIYAHTHKGLRKITAKFRNGVKPLYEVVTKSGYKTRITADHKVATLRAGQITTVPLRELGVGEEILLLMGAGVETDYVRMKPLNYERSGMSITLSENLRLPEVLTEDLAYLVGYLHGDASLEMGKKVNLSAPKAISIAAADSHPQILERLTSIMRSSFGIEPTAAQGDGAAKTVALDSRGVVEWMIANGLLKAKADNVRVPEAIFRSPSSVMAAFIAGCFDSVGCFQDGQGGCGVDSISRAMLEDMQQLLAINGIASHMQAVDRSAQGLQSIHRLMVTGDTFIQRFASLIDTAKDSDTYPADVLAGYGIRSKVRHSVGGDMSARISVEQMGKSNAQWVADGQLNLAEQVDDLLSTLPDTIMSVTPLGDSDVYDFEVEDVHLLSGSGIYTSNSRRGALMLILNDWHPDVFDFIKSKRTAGQITNANISVNVSDKLMEAIKADGDWTLMFPDTSDPKYDKGWKGDIDAWKAAGGAVIEYRTVKAREVWDAIIESAWASAEPGLWFGERSNKESNSWYFNPLVCTNPCTTGDTLVSTEFGYTKARDLVPGMKIRTPAGLKPIEKVYNNGVQRIFRVEFSDGGHLECTADHKLKVVRGKKYEWVAVNELQEGDRVLVMPNESFGSLRRLPEEVIKHIQRRELNVPDYYDRTLGFLAGVVLGDGTLRKVKIRNSYAYQCKIAFGMNEPEWFEHVRSTVEGLGIHTKEKVYAKDVMLKNGTLVKHQSQQLECYKLASLLPMIGMEVNVKAPEKCVPDDFLTLDKEFLAGLLDGLFCTDGSIDMSRSNPLLRFHTSSKKLADQVRLMLLQFGIHARIYPDHRKRDLTYDGRSMYVKYDVVIMNEGIPRFYSEIGLSHPQKAARLKDVAENWHYNGGTWSASVVSIEDTGREEEVFDVYEPDTLTWITNGYVSFDCGEQSLGAYSVCNLGAINLAKFYDEDKHDVAWDTLDTAVRYATRFLDNVIDSTPYFFEENERVQKGERRVGLNNMGLAELLIKLELRYGSPESVVLIDKLYAFIARASYETSIELAKEKGAFPQFDGEKFVQSGFMQKMPADIRERVRKEGIRNVTLLTQAPTGTTGTMVNTSTGIEPFFSWKYYRKSRLGLHEENVPIAQEWLDAHPGATELPDYFATAMDLAPEDHARVQAAIQRWVDSSISKTSNLPNNYSVEQVGKFYELLYELGCKGGTVYRDGSRSEQVLMLKGDERAESEMQENAQAKKAAAAQEEQVATPHRVYPRPKKLSGVTVNTLTPYGTSYITMNSDEHGYPFEVFITAPGKAGSDLQADAEGLGRMISLQLRTTAPQNRLTMLRLIVDQLQGIGGSRTAGFGPNRVLSLPDAVASALMDHYFQQEKIQQLNLFGGAAEETTVPVQNELPMVESNGNGNGNGHHPNGLIVGATLCPSCSTVSLVRADGCRKCLTCGYSEC